MASGNATAWTAPAARTAKRKRRCAACKSALAEQPVAPEIKPEPEVKLEPEIKPEPEIKQEPFTIRGYFGIRD